jgi:hypothetical protein
VVAPTNVTVPFSTKGRKPSCCARLKRWISSTNSKVDFAGARHVRLRQKPSSGRPRPKTPRRPSKRMPTASASSRAIVVLPVPGGPHRMIEDSRPAATIRPIAPSGPVRCSCPPPRPAHAGGFGRQAAHDRPTATGIAGVLGKSSAIYQQDRTGKCRCHPWLQFKT